MTAESSSLLIEDMTISRGAGPVVRSVSLEITPGEVTALLGPNGAGKSSLVLAVGGVLHADGGRVLLDGHDLRGKRPERIRQAGIAIVPEGRRLLRELTVGDNLDVACYALSRSQAKEGREHALTLFPELTKRLELRAGSMSGGEQQMLVLAQALVSQPRFIFVDELSLGLAPVVVKRLVPTLRTVAEAGVGVLLIEQFATVALGVSNRAYVMDRGRVQFSGMASELQENPDLLHSSYLLAGAGGCPPRAGGSAVRRPGDRLVAGLPDLGRPVLLDLARREEGDDPQVLLTGVAQVVRDALLQDVDVPGAHRPRALVEEQIPGAREDELGLLGGVDVPAQPLSGGHREVDGGAGVGVRASVGEELPDPLRVVRRARGQRERIEAVDVDRLHHRF
jgi:branched-chain amino acid transport system ATP-binding protein